jgi:hypothetical protein
MKKEFPIKPIKEGTTKSNVKKSNGKGRQAPPPPQPAIKKDIPLFDPNTGEPNPLYEELTGKPNPLLDTWKKEDFYNVPQNFEPVLKNRFLVIFPEELNIEPYRVTDIKLPSMSVSKKWGKIEYHTSDLELKMIDSVNKPKLPLIHSIFREYSKFDMVIEQLDAKNISYRRFELKNCCITRIDCETMGYGNPDNEMYNYRVIITPYTIDIK